MFKPEENLHIRPGGHKQQTALSPDGTRAALAGRADTRHTMSEYTEVEQPFLQQLAAQGWTVVDQGSGVPHDAAPSLRRNFREWLLPAVFDDAVRAINRTGDGKPWLTDRQLEDLRSQLLRQPNRTLLEANEAVQALLFKDQVDRNELTGESDPVVRLIDFHTPELGPGRQPVRGFPQRHAYCFHRHTAAHRAAWREEDTQALRRVH